MNNPMILDIAVGFILHKHSKDADDSKLTKAQAIRELNDDELASLLNEIVANDDNCPRTIAGWKEWLAEEVK